MHCSGEDNRRSFLHLAKAAEGLKISGIRTVVGRAFGEIFGNFVYEIFKGTEGEKLFLNDN